MSTVPLHTPLKRGWLCLALLIVLLALAASPALAQAPPPPPPAEDTEQVEPSPEGAEPSAAGGSGGLVSLDASETSLVMRGNTGETLGRTFVLKAVGGAASNVRISASDLLETASDRAILSTQITVNPAQIAVLTDVQTVAITVAPGTANAGVYTGTLSIWYASTPLTTTTPLTAPLTIALRVTLDAAPNVTADANSVNQTLFAQTTDLPFIGAPTQQLRAIRLPFAGVQASIDRPVRLPFTRITMDPRPPLLGELPITLIENTQEPALVTSAEVLPVRHSNGLVLPVGVVRIDARLPLEIPGQGAVTLPLTLAGRNLPAGAYTGNVRIQVANQTAAVMVPFAMQLKDGWLWAMGVLAASLVVGIAVAWYNGRGGPAMENIRKIEQRSAQLRENPAHLPIEDHNKANKLLAEAMDALRFQQPQTLIEQKLQLFDAHVASAAKAVATLCEQSVQVRRQVDAISGAPEIQQDLLARLEALQRRIEQGKLATLSEGEDLLAAVKAELDALSKLQEAIGALPADDRAAIEVATARSMQEIGERLRARQAARVQSLTGRATKISAGVAARDGLIARLNDIQTRLAAVKWNELGQIGPEVAQAETDLQDLEALQAALQQAMQQGGQDVQQSLDGAATVQGLRLKLAEAQTALNQQPRTPVSPGDAFAHATQGNVSFDIPVAVSPVANPLDRAVDALAQVAPPPPAKTAQQQWQDFTLGVRWRAVLIQGLLYIFAMLVGWAALYLPNTTFGARPEDYITLFLWGATVNVVAGNQIKLETIYGHKAPKLEPAPAADPNASPNADDAAPEQTP